MVRAKFRCSSINPAPGVSDEARHVILEAQYDETLPEDQRYSKFTPSGKLEMVVDNPPALAQFTVGQTYYIDFTPVD